MGVNDTVCAPCLPPLRGGDGKFRKDKMRKANQDVNANADFPRLHHSNLKTYALAYAL